MNIFARPPDSATQEETADGYPPAKQSLHAIRTLIDSERLRGTMEITRGDFNWQINATFHSAIDYNLSISGASLDEVAFTTLDALQQMLP